MMSIDPQFKALKDWNLVGAPFNVHSKAEHVHMIERWHRTVKERYHCYYAKIPFKHLPRRMVIELMITVCFYVNAFAWKCGASEVLPPLTIVEGLVLDYNLHFRVIFGEFCQTYESTSNTMNLRATNAVALGPNENL